MGAFKLARFAFDKLATLLVSQRTADKIDVARLTIQSKPFSDSDVRARPLCPGARVMMMVVGGGAGGRKLCPCATAVRRRTR